MPDNLALTANSPQLAPTQTTTTDNKMTNLRVKMGRKKIVKRNCPVSILNPTAQNSSLELMDTCIIQAPDRTSKKCRLIHDQFEAGDTLADI